MTAVVDFLPPSYREMLANRRQRSHRIRLAIPILAALVGTDLLFRSRIQGLSEMARLAVEHADLNVRRGLETEALEQRVASLRGQIERDSEQLTATRMTELLGALLADKPPGVRFRNLQCRFDPWAKDAAPALQLDASCADLEDLGVYLAALRESSILPPLECARADRQAEDGRHGFHLENRRTPSPGMR